MVRVDRVSGCGTLCSAERCRDTLYTDSLMGTGSERGHSWADRPTETDLLLSVWGGEQKLSLRCERCKLCQCRSLRGTAVSYFSYLEQANDKMNSQIPLSFQV